MENQKQTQEVIEVSTQVIDSMKSKLKPRTTVRFSIEEFDHIRSDTNLTGISIPLLLKRAYFKRPRLSPLMSKADQKMLMGQLARFGNNLNQIARALNSGFREGFNDEISQIQRDFSRLVTFITSTYGRNEDHESA